MTVIINRDNPKKLYVQLLEILKGKIERGEWAVDAQIPTEDDLCKMYEVSKATVRQAVAELVRTGYLLKQQGRGTFVCKRVIPEGLSMLTSFRELMLEAKVVFSTRVLAQTVLMPTDDLDLKLNIPEDTHVIYLKRLRVVEDEPILLQESYLPYHICPQLLQDDLEQHSLLEILENKYQIKITKVQEFIEVTPVSDDEGNLLGLRTGTPALLLEQRFFAGTREIMYTRSLKRPERFRFFIERERKT
jgi:GntR family transcriptional regulator